VTFDVFGDFTEIRDAAVGAGTDESDVDFHALDRSPCRELHVSESFLDICFLLRRRCFERVRDVLGDGDTCVWGNAPSDGRLDVLGGDFHDVIEMRIGIRGEGEPALGGFVEIVVVHVWTAFEVFDGFGVGIDVAAAGATFDGHVADGHALFHGHALEDIASVFVGVADATVGAELTDDVEDHVLGVNAGAKIAVHLDAADFHFLQRDGLSGEDVADLAGADTEGDRSEGAVGGGVGIAAGNGGAWLGDALLRADDVDDALFAGFEVEIGDAKVIAVLADRIDHFRCQWVGWLILIDGWDDVVDGREGALREFYREIEIPEHAESLWRSDLVNEVCADEELRASVAERADAV